VKSWQQAYFAISYNFMLKNSVVCRYKSTIVMTKLDKAFHITERKNLWRLSFPIKKNVGNKILSKEHRNWNNSVTLRGMVGF
jgi:hypothetical protein